MNHPHSHLTLFGNVYIESASIVQYILSTYGSSEQRWSTTSYMSPNDDSRGMFSDEPYSHVDNGWPYCFKSYAYGSDNISIEDIDADT